MLRGSTALLRPSRGTLVLSRPVTSSIALLVLTSVAACYRSHELSGEERDSSVRFVDAGPALPDRCSVLIDFESCCLAEGCGWFDARGGCFLAERVCFWQREPCADSTCSFWVSGRTRANDCLPAGDANWIVGMCTGLDSPVRP